MPLDTDINQAQEAFTQAASLGGISFLASTARRAIKNEVFTSFAGFISSNIMAGFVGVMCYLILHDITLDAYWKFAITGICAFWAEDLLLALVLIGKRITEKPIEVALRIILRE